MISMYCFKLLCFGLNWYVAIGNTERSLNCEEFTSPFLWDSGLSYGPFWMALHLQVHLDL